MSERVAGRARLGLMSQVALIVGAAIGTIGGNLMPVLLSGFGDEFGLSDMAAGLVAAAQLLATAAAALSLSRRAAQHGRVRLASAGLIVAAAGFAAAWLSTSVVTLTVSSVVAGAGVGAVFAAAAASLSSTPDVDRATGITVVGCAVTIAALIIGVSFAIAEGGGTAGFLVVAVCCLAGLTVVRGLPERPVGSSEGEGPPLSLFFLFAVALLGVTEQGAWSYTAVIAERYTGLSASGASFVLSAAAVAALLGVPLAAVATRRLGRPAALIAIFALECVAKLLVAGAPSAQVFVVATLLWQVCYLALLVQTLAIAALGDRSGRWAAAAGGALAIGTGIGPAMVGGVLDALGGWGLGVCLVAATSVAGVALVRLATRVSEEADACDAAEVGEA